MNKKKIEILVFCIIFLLINFQQLNSETIKKVLLPVNVIKRNDYKELVKISLDGFGAFRTAGHKHAGLDIEGKYGEFVYSIGIGVVKAIYGEYPYKTVLIEHQLENGEIIFSGYTHIEDITVNENDDVNENTKIGRMFYKEEYIRSEFYKNHVHLEIRKTMERYKGISIKCYTMDDLNKYFYDPQIFFKKYLK